ncbi:MAG: hypothetical protein J7502_06620 [Flavisolibacter sp.]|nr:hypothetical protein [Flavisolibacter sp.]
MPRTKEKRKFVHEPSTHEIFICLSSLPSWTTILLQNGTQKPYMPFLQWLIERNFYEEREEKITIKRIASDYKSETTKVTKWLHEIYDDIIELNYERPKLFVNNKATVTCYFSYYDSHAAIHLGLDFLPRVYEEFSFFFIKARTGADRFWISKVQYEVFDKNVQATLWLEGGILNRYREMAVEEGLFKGWLGFMDKWHKHSF